MLACVSVAFVFVLVALAVVFVGVFIVRWNGTLPQYMLGGATPFLNIK